MSIRAWLCRYQGKLRRRMSEEDVQQALTKAGRALEVQVLDKPQAEVDKVEAEAAAALITALANHEQGVIKVGSLLCLKTTLGGVSSIFIRNLTQVQLAYLDSHPSCMETPNELLARLEQGCHADSSLVAGSEMTEE
jgi:hypothetical protein